VVGAELTKLSIAVSNLCLVMQQQRGYAPAPRSALELLEFNDYDFETFTVFTKLCNIVFNGFGIVLAQRVYDE
jgi:hypothetical protein